MHSTHTPINNIIHKNASFLFPVIDGQLYVGQRNTPPHQGKYGPIGGKADSPVTGALFNKPHLITKMGGHQVTSIADKLCEEDNLEYSAETAVREFLEEVYSDKKYPNDFKTSDVTNIEKIDMISDRTQTLDYACRTYIARVHRKDFNISQRELSSFVPVSTIHPHECFPFAQLILYQLRNISLNHEFNIFGPEGYADIKFAQQIPDFEPQIDKLYPTTLFYPLRFQREKGFFD